MVIQASSLRRPEPEGSSLTRPAALSADLQPCQAAFSAEDKLHLFHGPWGLASLGWHAQFWLRSGPVSQIPAAVDILAFCKVLGWVLPCLWGFRFLVSPPPSPPPRSMPTCLLLIFWSLCSVSPSGVTSMLSVCRLALSPLGTRPPPLSPAIPTKHLSQAVLMLSTESFHLLTGSYIWCKEQEPWIVSHNSTCGNAQHTVCLKLIVLRTKA